MMPSKKNEAKKPGKEDKSEVIHIKTQPEWDEAKAYTALVSKDKDAFSCP
jgi:hypothetical protein